jgi:hypothetical protein
LKNTILKVYLVYGISAGIIRRYVNIHGIVN